MSSTAKNKGGKSDAASAAKKAKTSSSSSSSSNYNWEALHADLEKGQAAGTYGGPNAVYFGMSGIRAGVDMRTFHTKRGADETFNPSMKALLEDPRTRESWAPICTFDPLGMFATRPTHAATTATMVMPELEGQLEADGKIVNEDGSMNIVKTAVDYVWNLPALSERINIPETDLRQSLYDFTGIESVRKPELRAFLPPTGALTVYIWGDPTKLADKETEVAVRVHDQCTGSDVFGTDICTCRPYLVFAVKACVEVAQRGGVGVVVYFQKEGRSLGEVTKYRVYNARKNQDGGDRPEKYFYQTESIAGIRDARFQEMMPDALLWLGIKRIDWLLSMSSEKYDAITSVGIKVMQRISLPDSFVPKGAGVEISAKIASGYHTDSLSSGDISSHLKTLQSIRERTKLVYDLALEGKSVHFALDESKIGACTDLVMKVTKGKYPEWKDVPYHSRWRHFLPGTVEALSASWHCDETERARRLLDLVFVSVLLDAGSGQHWRYTNENGDVIRRSEGIAVATLDMFKDGLFSSDAAMPHRVNALGLKNFSEGKLAQGFQISSSNTMVGVHGRWALLQRLADAMDANPQFFGRELRRPGNLVDYVIAKSKDRKVSVRDIWEVVIVGLESIWPNHMSGLVSGDMWVYNPLKEAGKPGSDLIPFHKLSQWLSLSLLEPIEALGYTITDMNLFTGLAEYRNGGLLVDTGVLVLKDEDTSDIAYDVGSEVVVEWRALTVQLLDRVHAEVCKRCGLTPEQLPLTKVLEGGTWAAGRVVAAEKREGGGPPIKIRSDGAVF